MLSMRYSLCVCFFKQTVHLMSSDFRWTWNKQSDNILYTMVQTFIVIVGQYYE